MGAFHLSSSLSAIFPDSSVEQFPKALRKKGGVVVSLLRPLAAKGGREVYHHNPCLPEPGASLLRSPDAAIVDAGGSDDDKLLTHDRSGAGPLRSLQSGDELLIADHHVVLAGVSQGLPRFPSRPLFDGKEDMLERHAAFRLAQAGLLPDTAVDAVLATAVSAFDDSAPSLRPEALRAIHQPEWTSERHRRVRTLGALWSAPTSARPTARACGRYFAVTRVLESRKDADGLMTSNSLD